MILELATAGVNTLEDTLLAPRGGVWPPASVSSKRPPSQQAHLTTHHNLVIAVTSSCYHELVIAMARRRELE